MRFCLVWPVKRVFCLRLKSNLFQILRNSRDQTLFAFGIYSGLRIGEIIEIKQSQVYTTSGGIKNALKVIRQKTIQTLYSDIPIHPKLRDQLLKYKEDLPKGTWLFPSDSAAGHLGRCRAHLILRSAFDGLRLDDADRRQRKVSASIFFRRLRGLPQ